MADEPNRSIVESVRLWTTAVAIPIVLAVAGFWQFYLKEVVWPAAAINLTADVTVKEAGITARAADEARNLEAIELVITARNPSSSTVYLCANYWAAWGAMISASEQDTKKSEEWLESVAKAINDRYPLIVGKHYNSDRMTLVSAGSIFSDIGLRPNEKISATFIFYVPQDFYDLIAVFVMLPTTSRSSPSGEGPALKINYERNKDGFISIASVERVTSNGPNEKLALNEAMVKIGEYLGLQLAQAKVALSLQRSTTSPHTTPGQSETSSSQTR